MYIGCRPAEIVYTLKHKASQDLLSKVEATYKNKRCRRGINNDLDNNSGADNSS